MIDNVTLAHNFAHNRDKDKCSNNMHYNNCDEVRYCYSFNTVVAVIDGNVCYISNINYSRTTQKHIHYIISATSHLKQIYCAYPAGRVDDNMLEYAHDIKDILLAKARKPDTYLVQIAKVVSSAKDYARAKGIELSKELQYYGRLTSNSRVIAAAKKDAERAKKVDRERVQKWMRGDNIMLNSNYCLLRYIAHKGYTIIETSKGVKVNIATAVEFAKKLLSDNISTGYPRTTIANYSVTSCNNSTVKIGCHTFRRSYLNNFAKRLISQYA